LTLQVKGATGKIGFVSRKPIFPVAATLRVAPPLMLLLPGCAVIAPFQAPRHGRGGAGASRRLKRHICG